MGFQLPTSTGEWVDAGFQPSISAIFSWLVVEPTHLKKYARQIGSCPQGSGVNIKKYLSYHHPVRDFHPDFLLQLQVSIFKLLCKSSIA